MPRRSTAAASATPSRRSKAACTARLWPKNTGTRTAVALTAKLRQPEHAAGLLPQAPLLARYSTFLQCIHLGNHVEGNLPAKGPSPRLLAAQHGHRLPGQFIHGPSAAARHRLIGGHIDPLEAREGMQRRERRGQRDAGASGQRDQSARAHGLQRPCD